MSEVAISDREFVLFRQLMHDVAGVDLAPSKKHLVSGRLSRRLREHRLTSFADYYRLVSQQPGGEEFQRMVDLLTTHETYFFREPRHFDYLAQHVLPALAGGREIRVWSAASSTGEEAYSLAMVLMDRLGPAAAWRIFASDISREVVQRARQAIYPKERLRDMPADYVQRFCLRGIGSQQGSVRVAPEIRERVEFAQVNLNQSLSGVGEFDVIFLRNVLIYFDQQTKRQIVHRLAGQLRHRGWLFVGHSETLNGLSSVLHLETPTVYRRL